MKKLILITLIIPFLLACGNAPSQPVNCLEECGEWENGSPRWGECMRSCEIANGLR